MFYQQNKLFRLFSLQNKLMISCLALLMLHNISPVHAANQKKTKQNVIEIKAQYLSFDRKKGLSKYKGKVLLTKGTLIIKADTVTLYFNGEKLTKALITGSPADVQHQPDNEAKTHSQANEIEYLIAEEQLILKGQAFVNQGNRHFSGEYIEYDTHQRTITAAGDQNTNMNTKNSTNNPPKARVHVIIGPNKDDKDVADTNNIENNEIKIK